MGSHMSPSKDLSSFWEGGRCYARSLSWLTRVCAHTLTHTHTHTDTHTDTHTHMYRIHTHTHACMFTHTHTQPAPPPHTRTHVHTHTHTHIHIHTHSHTHIILTMQRPLTGSQDVACPLQLQRVQRPRAVPESGTRRKPGAHVCKIPKQSTFSHTQYCYEVPQALFSSR